MLTRSNVIILIPFVMVHFYNGNYLCVELQMEYGQDFFIDRYGIVKFYVVRNHVLLSLHSRLVTFFFNLRVVCTGFFIKSSENSKKYTAFSVVMSLRFYSYKPENKRQSWSTFSVVRFTIRMSFLVRIFIFFIHPSDPRIIVLLFL